LKDLGIQGFGYSAYCTFQISELKTWPLRKVEERRGTQKLLSNLFSDFLLSLAVIKRVAHKLREGLMV